MCRLCFPGIPSLVRINFTHKAHEDVPRASLIPPSHKRDKAHKRNRRNGTGFPKSLRVLNHVFRVLGDQGDSVWLEWAHPLVYGDIADIRAVDSEDLHQSPADGGQRGDAAQEDVEKVPYAAPKASKQDLASGAIPPHFLLVWISAHLEHEIAFGRLRVVEAMFIEPAVTAEEARSRYMARVTLLI